MRPPTESFVRQFAGTAGEYLTMWKNIQKRTKAYINVLQTLH